MQSSSKKSSRTRKVEFRLKEEDFPALLSASNHPESGNNNSASNDVRSAIGYVGMDGGAGTDMHGTPTRSQSSGSGTFIFPRGTVKGDATSSYRDSNFNRPLPVRSYSERSNAETEMNIQRSLLGSQTSALGDRTTSHKIERTANLIMQLSRLRIQSSQANTQPSGNCDETPQTFQKNVKTQTDIEVFEFEDPFTSEGFPNDGAANVPEEILLTDHYGLEGWKRFMQGATADPAVWALYVGIPAFPLIPEGSPGNAPPDENIFSVASDLPWGGYHPSMADVEAKVPEEYLMSKYSSIRDKLPDIEYSKMSDDQLFFLFYNLPGELYQILAAKELYNRNWRYHKTERVWLKRLEQIVDTRTKMYEEGIYTVFNNISWEIENREMKIWYGELTGKPELPPFFQKMQHDTEKEVSEDAGCRHDDGVPGRSGKLLYSTSATQKGAASLPYISSTAQRPTENEQRNYSVTQGASGNVTYTGPATVESSGPMPHAAQELSRNVLFDSVAEKETSGNVPYNVSITQEPSENVPYGGPPVAGILGSITYGGSVEQAPLRSTQYSGPNLQSSSAYVQYNETAIQGPSTNAPCTVSATHHSESLPYAGFAAQMPFGNVPNYGSAAQGSSANVPFNDPATQTHPASVTSAGSTAQGPIESVPCSGSVGQRPPGSVPYKGLVVPEQSRIVSCGTFAAQERFEKISYDRSAVQGSSAIVPNSGFAAQDPYRITPYNPSSVQGSSENVPYSVSGPRGPFAAVPHESSAGQMSSLTSPWSNPVTQEPPRIISHYDFAAQGFSQNVPLNCSTVQRSSAVGAVAREPLRVLPCNGPFVFVPYNASAVHGRSEKVPYDRSAMKGFSAILPHHDPVAEDPYRIVPYNCSAVQEPPENVKYNASAMQGPLASVLCESSGVRRSSAIVPYNMAVAKNRSRITPYDSFAVQGLSENMPCNRFAVPGSSAIAPSNYSSAQGLVESIPFSSSIAQTPQNNPFGNVPYNATAVQGAFENVPYYGFAEQGYLPRRMLYAVRKSPKKSI